MPESDDRHPAPCDADPEETAFTAVWSLADSVPGWLTQAQARRLWEEVARLPRGAHVVEIGSHQGRSTVVLAAAAQVVGAQVTAVDAFVNGPRYGGPATRDRLEANLRRVGAAEVVTILPARSATVRRSWALPIGLLWIDGKHDYWTCSDDLRWSRHLPLGGRVLVHDAFSSLGVTLSLLVHVLPSRRLRYTGRVGSLATLEVAPTVLADRARLLRELPWWLRNLAVKALLRLRLRGIAARLGHRDAADPF